MLSDSASRNGSKDRPGSSSAAAVTAVPVAVGGGAADVVAEAEELFGFLIHGASRLSSGVVAVGALFGEGLLIPAFAAAAFCTCSSSCRADFSSSAAARLPEAAMGAGGEPGLPETSPKICRSTSSASCSSLEATAAAPAASPSRTSASENRDERGPGVGCGDLGGC